MRCPRCNQQFYHFSKPCPICQFSGDASLIEELAYIGWLLNETDIWQPVERQSLPQLRQKYADRRKKIEIALGLRLPPFTKEEAREAWPKFMQQETLLQYMAAWLAQGLLNPTATQTMMSATRQQVDQLLERLEGHLRSASVQTDSDRLDLINFLLNATDQISQVKGFITSEAEDQARRLLLTEKETLEIKLGLRLEPMPEAVPEKPVAVILEEHVEPTPAEDEAQLAFLIEPAAEETPVVSVPAAPRVPLRERLWQMLLSERTLQAMLFLGIFLLFSAALSFVAWGWKDFSAPLRVAIPTGFTSVFFILGWYVRTKTPMYRSGIALSAIAALLIPIDFYTVYVNFHIPAHYWPLFWFITSTVCLLAYIAATFIIRSQFFGYLVGVAAGSMTLALVEMSHQAFHLSLDWRSTALSGLCLGLTILATTLIFPSQRVSASTLKQIFANPLRYLALFGISIIMLFTFGWRFTQRETYDTFHYALTVNWCFGSLIFAWNAFYYQNRQQGVLAAIALPISVYLAQAAFFNQTGISPAWHAFGWAWLIFCYFALGHRLLKYNSDAILYGHGQTATKVGLILLIITAFWPLLDIAQQASAAAATHTVLACVVLLATLLWQRPVYLYGASFFSFSAATFSMAEIGLTSAQLGVGWATLAIVHIGLALTLGTRFPTLNLNLNQPLIIAGYITAALAILPPLLPYQGGLLTYTLGNWLALTAWGARLGHLNQPGFSGERGWQKSVFHWLTALSLPFWLWALLTNFDALDSARPPALAVLAWLVVMLSYRLNQITPIYRWPWYWVGLLTSIAAPVTAFAITPDGFVPPVTLLLAGLLYFFDAFLYRQSLEMVPGGLVTAWGYLLLLSRFHLPAGAISFGFGLLIALYLLSGLWAENKKSPVFSKQFFSPLYLTGHFLTFLLLAGIYLHPLNKVILNIAWTDQTRLWQAAGQMLLAGVYGFYAWSRYKEHWAHLAAWLITGGSSFVAITYSTGYGSSVAAELALLAVAFVLIERSLYRKQHRQELDNGQSEFIRLTWQLFRRPLLVAGWVVSAGVIGLALLYNLWSLGGGRTEQIWAMGALTLITGLYAFSARLFQQTRFVWLAALLSFAPWTVLTDLAWSTFAPHLSHPGIYILSWPLLAWVLFLSHLRLEHLNLRLYAWPPKAVAHAFLLLSLGWSISYDASNSYSQAVGLLLIGLLYLSDSVINRHSFELAPGGLITAWGYTLLLSQLNLSFDALGLVLTLLTGSYILTGLWVERGRSSVYTHQFLSPLYLIAHVVTANILWRIYVRPFDELLFNITWTDEMRLWGAAGQLILGILYGLYAWGTYKERWAHFAAWLMALGGGFVAIVYSSGSGSSTAKIALAAIVFVLVERGLYQLRRHPKLSRRQQAFIRLTWRLYRSPLLVTGWVMSAGVIGLALIRNLVLLGGETRQIWAIIALLLITGLYALSARLFRQARFGWLAGCLIFAPWTILTHLGWLTPYRPTLPGYALSWALLAWLLLLVSLPLTRRKLKAYALPLEWVANVLMPFSLLWGGVDTATGRFTLALAIGFYGLGAILNHRQFKRSGETFSTAWQTKFFYPALGLTPVWCAYLMTWFLPRVQAEHYGLMLLVFGPPGILLGQWLYRLAPQPKAARGYAFPAYLTGYTSLAIGTILVANEPALLALALLFDALLMLVSARLFKHPVWGYLAVLFTPLSLWLALQESNVSFNRYGWWLIGLASIYLGLAWLLRRLHLAGFGTAPLVAGFSLIALGLPPSSLDQTGALWGYGDAALLYTLTAFWLRQPLLLTPASVLAVIPYLVILQKSPLAPEYYGLALFLGSVIAVALGHKLDRRYGAVNDFPWNTPADWLMALINRFLEWWAFPLYLAGFGVAIISPLFARFEPAYTAINFFLMMPLFGWAIYRFRLRGWLVATALAGHLAAIFYLEAINWWSQSNSAVAWLGFLPVTVIMAGVTLFIRYWRKEKLSTSNGDNFDSWAYPLYIITIVDITIGQFWSLNGTSNAAFIALIHAFLVGVFASARLSVRMVYIGLSLGAVSLTQILTALHKPIESLPVALSQLILVYGLGGYGLAYIRSGLEKDREVRPWIGIWELPLQRFSMAVSLGTLVLTSWLGVELFEWSIRAFLGLPFRMLVNPGAVQMVVGVLGFLGLLYVTAAFIHQWPRLGYVAIGMLLTAWMLHVFYIQEWDDFRQVQWYAMPAGVYLLGVAYLEWHQGNRPLARWLDYASMFLMIGSLFWQTLLFGWLFALLLGSEGLAALFWGSGRRLRRFLNAGMSGVVLATLGQLLNSLQSINQWIVFGIVGLSLVLVAIMVERRLEDIKAWYEIIESWE